MIDEQSKKINRVMIDEQLLCIKTIHTAQSFKYKIFQKQSYFQSILETKKYTTLEYIILKLGLLFVEKVLNIFEILF